MQTTQMLLEKANAMQTAIDAFVANPTQTSFDAAKTAWLGGT
jgi:uncharacterized iron-regulated protein